MYKHWAYILVGDNNSGKTSFQKNLIYYLCKLDKSRRLNTNEFYDVRDRKMPASIRHAFFMNRSIQEKMSTYKTVENFFSKYFQAKEICFLSSHAHGHSINDIEKMISLLKYDCYNVAGVFFSNAWTQDAQEISRNLPWNEVIWLDNPKTTDQTVIDQQIKRLAKDFRRNLRVRSQSAFGRF